MCRSPIVSNAGTAARAVEALTRLNRSVRVHRLELTNSTMSNNENSIIWGRHGTEILHATRCDECGGMGRVWSSSFKYVDCEHCASLGWLGIDPRAPTIALPGTVAKIAVLSVRYASGVPLFHEHDYQDPDLTSRRDVASASVSGVSSPEEELAAAHCASVTSNQDAATVSVYTESFAASVVN